ncbi:MAG TPA: hypothetical protein GX734_02235 [Clostridiaceae bacterium]|jgi:two-component system sensor histidine kinase YcbA|nr:hypothetical protein [Clostridiaceae bacterium]
MVTTFLVALLTALASLVHIPVGDSDFRVTLGMVVMMTGYLILRKRKILQLAFFSGMFVGLLRIIVASISGMTMTPKLAGSLLLEFFFYIGYGLLYRFTVELNKSIYKIPLLFSLVICDFGGNAIEYLLRFLYAAEVWKDTSLVTILIAAFVRSLAIVVCVFLYRRFIEPQLTSKKGGSS